MAAATAASPPPPPTVPNIHYGPHERQVLDFWQAASDRPTPVVVHLHGGGWVNGDKGSATAVDRFLAAGISVVSINYRFIQQAIADNVVPPVRAPMQDAARAIQFIRHRAAAWNLDPRRIAATGVSAGACTSLWLAFHDDLADPGSADPVARESTRLACVAVDNAQTTLDPVALKEWVPNSRYGGHAFGFWPAPHLLKDRDRHFAEFLAARGKLLPAIREYSPLEHVSTGDPPVYLFYRRAPFPLGQEQPDPTHTAIFGMKLLEALRLAGVPGELVYPGAAEVRHPALEDFLIERLLAPAGEKERE